MNGTIRKNRHGGKCASCTGWVAPEQGSLANEAGRWTVRHIGACPTVVEQAAAMATPGYYVTADDQYVVVVENKTKTATYAKRLVVVEPDCGGCANGEPCGSGCRFTASWEYAPGVAATLAGLEPLTVEQAASFGHLHGVCMICCRALTDPESVQRGIGPVCIKRVTA